MDDFGKSLLWAGLTGAGMGCMVGIIVCALTTAEPPRNEQHKDAEKCQTCHTVMRVQMQ